MATYRKLPLGRIESVIAGGTAIIQASTSVRYHGIGLEYDTDTAGGATEVNMEAEIKEVRCLLEEVTQRKASASQIFDINRTKGIAPIVGDATKPGYIPLFFSEPQRNTKALRESTAWGMGGVGDFQIEIDIVDNGQVPKLKAFAIVDDIIEAPAGIVKWKRNNITISETGEVPYYVNTTSGDSIQSLMFFEKNIGDIADILLEWDGVKIEQFTASQRNAYFNSFGDNAEIVEKLQHVLLDHNNPADALRTTTDINGTVRNIEEVLVTLNMAAANNVTLIREVIGVPD